MKQLFQNVNSSYSEFQDHRWFVFFIFPHIPHVFQKLQSESLQILYFVLKSILYIEKCTNKNTA